MPGKPASTIQRTYRPELEALEQRLVPVQMVNFTIKSNPEGIVFQFAGQTLVTNETIRIPKGTKGMLCAPLIGPGGIRFRKWVLPHEDTHPCFGNSPITVNSNITYKVRYSSSVQGVRESPDKVGAYHPGSGLFFTDANGNRIADDLPRWPFQRTGGRPVAGDWDGNGRDDLGLYQNGHWLLDSNGNGRFDFNDDRFTYGGIPGDQPIEGDWDRDGDDDIGIYRSIRGVFILNDNDRNFSSADDPRFLFDGRTGGTAVIGDWNGDGRDDLGTFRQGFWRRDLDGDRAYTVRGDGLPPIFLAFRAGDRPVSGDWNGDGFDEIGVYRAATHQWFLDTFGDLLFTAKDRPAFVYTFLPGELPVTGDWA